jgi:hypothetical protein
LQLGLSARHALQVVDDRVFILLRTAQRRSFAARADACPGRERQLATVDGSLDVGTFWTRDGW